MPEKVIFMDFFPSSISCLPRISFYWLILAASPQQRGHKVAWPLLYRWSSNSAGTTSWERLASWLLPQSTLNGCYYCSKSRVFCAHVLSHSGSIPAIDLHYKTMTCKQLGIIITLKFFILMIQQKRIFLLTIYTFINLFYIQYISLLNLILACSTS